MDEYVEYYISCNPPLVSAGVEEVIQAAKTSCGEILTEILYEPDVPWFKCISKIGDKATICDNIDAVLADIVNDDVDIIDDDQGTSGCDVSIVTDNPRVMSWATHNKSDWTKLGFVDKAVFPEPLSPVKFKTLWRGLESCHRSTSLQKLLSQCREILGNVMSESSTDVYTIDNCPVSYNMSNSLVYIGSNESEGALETVVAKLYMLVEISNSAGKCSHSILTNTTAETQFAYKWLSHLGMDRTTYLDASTENSDGYSVLLGAATVRTKLLALDGTWKSDYDNHANINYGKLPRDIECTALKNYQYPKIVSKQIKGSPNCVLGGSASAAIYPVENWREGVCNAVGDSGDSVIDAPEMSMTPSNAVDLLGDIRWDENQMLEPVASCYRPTSGTTMDDQEDLISFEETNIAKEMESFLSGTSSRQLLLHETLPPVPSLLCLETRYESLLEIESLTESPTKSPTRNPAKSPTKIPAKPAKRSARVTLPAKRRHDGPSPMFQDTKRRIKSHAAVLQVLPGQISLRLTFGRIYLKQFSSNLVELEKSQHYPREKTLQHLASLARNDIGFTPMLSTHESDIFALPAIKTPKLAQWDPISSKLYYDLSCEYGTDPTDCCMVEIDPDTGLTSHSPQREVFTTFIHCPSSKWDIKVSGQHSMDVSQKHGYWLEPWLDSVNVSTNNSGRLRMEFEDQPRGAAVVKAIKVRHVWQYQSDTNILEVALHRRLYKKGAAKPTTPNSPVRVTWEMPKVWQPGKGKPDQWVEASIESSITADLFASNLHMEMGSRARWTVEHLENSGVFEDFCHLGFEMVSQMDDIGSRNDNGEALNITVMPTRPGKEAGQRESSVYW